MPSYRAERISRQIHHQVSIMLEGEMNDPRLLGALVTHVEMSGDLRHAKIFVAPNQAGAEATREMMAGLEHATGYVRRQIAENLDLRFAPEIRFVIDTSYVQGERFLRALAEIHTHELSPEPNQTTRRRTVPRDE